MYIIYQIGLLLLLLFVNENKSFEPGQKNIWYNSWCVLGCWKRCELLVFNLQMGLTCINLVSLNTNYHVNHKMYIISQGLKWKIHINV